MIPDYTHLYKMLQSEEGWDVVVVTKTIIEEGKKFLGFLRSKAKQAISRREVYVLLW
jgi:hypothetical protein